MGDTLGFVSYNYSDLLLDKKAAQMIHKRKSVTLMRLYWQKQAVSQSWLMGCHFPALGLGNNSSSCFPDSLYTSPKTSPTAAISAALGLTELI